MTDTKLDTEGQRQRGEKESGKTRKTHGTSISPNEDTRVRMLHGKFLRALRNRLGKTAERLAADLKYQRPTQVLRREAGAIGIPTSEIDEVAQYLMCDPRLLLFARLIAFETSYYKAFGRGLSTEITSSDILIPESGILIPEKFFEQEIAAIERDKMGGVWRGVDRFIFKGTA